MWRADVCVMVSIWGQVRVYLGSMKVQKKLLSGDLRLGVNGGWWVVTFKLPVVQRVCWLLMPCVWCWKEGGWAR
jgi:hypothetical protein